MKKQFIPILLTVVTFFILVALLFGFINLLNLFPTKDKIVPILRLGDILVGLVIYLKTSVDFALFIGNLMKKYTGIKNRIAIEIGTAFGNGIGTMFVLFIWTFFKEVPILMAVMILLAAFVLLKMAQESLQELLILPHSPLLTTSIIFIKKILQKINSITHPFIFFIFPKSSFKKNTISFVGLLFFACTIPFILGLDDFAGYIPLFSIVNVFGFATGVFLGHMLLNLSLFASPKHTVQIIQQPLIIFLGSLAFIGIALWGFYEVFRLLILIF